jgi:hypothetical protein
MSTLPNHLKDEFLGFMEAHDLDDLPDGAWFAVLEQAAESFIKEHKLKRCDENDLAHLYLRLHSGETE